MTAVVQPYHLSVEEFVAFCGTDPGRYEQFELIEGEIWEPMPESAKHADMVEAVAEALRRRYTDQVVRSHGSVQLDGDGLVLPDAYVVKPGEQLDGNYWNGRQLELAVEVSVSTWTRDTGTKLRDYARGGVAVYYVLDLDRPEQEVHVFSDPRGSGYGSVEVHQIGVLLSPDGST